MPRDHPLLASGHGHAGAAYLAQAGHPELVRAVADHPVTRLVAPDAEEWIMTAPLEQRVVAYSDKRSMQRVVSLDQRFARWYQRHPAHVDRLALALERARRLEQQLCALAGLTPTTVVRLRWVEETAVRALGVPSVPAETPAVGWSPGRASAGAGLVSTVAIRPSHR